MTRMVTFEKVDLNFSKALRRIREKRGLSQGDVFRRSGVERTYISRIEQGLIVDPRISTVVILARALDVSVDELVREAEALAGEEPTSVK